MVTLQNFKIFRSRSLIKQGSGKETTHKHKQICGIVPGLGGCQNFVYVFFRVIPYGGEKHINKIPPKIPGQSREKFVYVFYSLCVFFSLPKGFRSGGEDDETSLIDAATGIGRWGATSIGSGLCLHLHAHSWPWNRFACPGREMAGSQKP